MLSSVACHKERTLIRQYPPNPKEPTDRQTNILNYHYKGMQMIYKTECVCAWEREKECQLLFFLHHLYFLRSIPSYICIFKLIVYLYIHKPHYILYIYTKNMSHILWIYIWKNYKENCKKITKIYLKQMSREDILKKSCIKHYLMHTFGATGLVRSNKKNTLTST